MKMKYYLKLIKYIGRILYVTICGHRMIINTDWQSVGCKLCPHFVKLINHNFNAYKPIFIDVHNASFSKIELNKIFKLITKSHYFKYVFTNLLPVCSTFFKNKKLVGYSLTYRYRYKHIKIMFIL